MVSKQTIGIMALGGATGAAIPIGMRMLNDKQGPIWPGGGMWGTWQTLGSMAIGGVLTGVGAFGLLRGRLPYNMATFMFSAGVPCCAVGLINGLLQYHPTIPPLNASARSFSVPRRPTPGHVPTVGTAGGAAGTIHI